MTSERIFRLFLRFYPSDFRKRYEGELVEFFLDERKNPRYAHGLLGTTRFWTKTVLDLLRAAIRLRRSPARSAPGQPEPGDKAGITMMETIWQDLKYSVRSLLRQPGFTAVVVATLALAIGANVAIFSVLNGVVLRSLPYEDPDGLAFVWEMNYQRDVETNVVSPANYLAWKDQNEVFSQIGALSEMSATITGDRGPERVGLMYLSPSVFSMLGPRAQLGRVLVEDDERAGAEPVVVLSDGFWQRRFGSDVNILGRSIVLNGTAYEVVGVLPPDFDVKAPVSFNATGSRDVWVPARFDENARNARGRWLQVLARFEQGVSLENAQAQMSTLASRLEREYPEAQSGWSIKIVPLHEQIVGDIRTTLIVLLGSVGFVLLIACANVANLLLAKAAGRQREIALRSALGAGRSRVARQLLTESGVLAFLGGTAGLILAYLALQVLLALSPENLPRLEEVRIDWMITAFTFAVSLTTAVLFGALPAARISAVDLKDGLSEGGDRSGTGLRHNRVRRTLVIAEFALSMMLLVGAGLLVRSFSHLLDVNVGFSTANVVTAQVGLPNSEYSEASDRIRFFEDLVERVQSIPGISDASAITFMPLAGSGSATSFWANDRPIPPDGELPVADVRWVHRDFHTALGVPLIDGRLFGEGDTEDAPLSVIINRTAAEQLWPSASAVGRTISMPWGDTLIAEIVGVVGDVLHEGPESDVRAMFYWEHRQFNVFNQMTVFARSTNDPATIVAGLRQAVNELDPNLPVYNVSTVESNYSGILAQDRFTMIAFGLFAIVALLLASVGIYGVMSYSVTERTREIGIKMALGAGARSVTLQVIRSGFALTVIAVVLGIIGSLSLSRVMSGLVFGVGTNDPATLIGVTLLLSAVALAACFFPARRASKVDPMEAMRGE